MTEPDELMAHLARLDPVSADPAPEPGSTRYESIEEQLMSTTNPPEDHVMIPGGVAEGEVDGANLHLTAGDLEFFRIDGTEWLGEGGEFMIVPAEEEFAPFGEASAAVITAALDSETVTEDGNETIRGVDTTRYVIDLDDRARASLAEVPSRAQFWFVGAVSEEIIEEGDEMIVSRRSGFLEDAEALTLWVADDLIHQISVDTGSTRFTYTFYDFDADITIVPPR